MFNSISNIDASPKHEIHSQYIRGVSFWNQIKNTQDPPSNQSQLPESPKEPYPIPPTPHLARHCTTSPSTSLGSYFFRSGTRSPGRVVLLAVSHSKSTPSMRLVVPGPMRSPVRPSALVSTCGGTEGGVGCGGVWSAPGQKATPFSGWRTHAGSAAAKSFVRVCWCRPAPGRPRRCPSRRCGA